MKLIDHNDYFFYSSKDLNFDISENARKIQNLDANPYGDWVTVSASLKLVTENFPNEKWKILEVGTAGGHFLKSMELFLESIKQNNCEAYGLDSKLHGYTPQFFDGINLHFIDGKSTDQNIIDSISDDFHFIFIDACHCRSHVFKDFLAFSKKIKIGGYIGLHDTSPTFQGGSPQPRTEECDPEDVTIQVVKGINDFNPEKNGFEHIFEEYDKTIYYGGVRVYKRIK
jgi:hypothetical protein